LYELVYWRPYKLPPSLSGAVTPIIELQIQVKKHVMRDEPMPEGINFFSVINKVPVTPDIVQNNLQNYVASYEIDLYHS